MRTLRRSPTCSRAGAVAALLAAKRAEHPELRGVPTLAGLGAVCRREGIRLARAPLATLGICTAHRGRIVIAVDVDLSDEAAAAVLAHELGHALLHVRDAALMAGVHVERTDTGVTGLRWLADMRPGPIERAIEREANLFAEGLGVGRLPRAA